MLYHIHPMHHVGCMTVLNLTLFRAPPPPSLDCVTINERPLRLQVGTGGQVTKL